MDPRTPVLIGCGQVKQRCDDPREALEPIAAHRNVRVTFGAERATLHA